MRAIHLGYGRNTMGYRSDVTCVMYHVDKAAENTLIIKEFIRQRITPELMEYFNFDDWGGVFEVEQWKWYESYSDIQMLEKLFNDYKEAFCEGGYASQYAIEYIRVGESYDDIETQEAGGTLGRLHVSRAIIID